MMVVEVDPRISYIFPTHYLPNMIDLERISSLDHPELRPYRTMRRAVEHIKQGIFIAEGEKVIRRFLESDLAVVSLLLTDEWFQRLEGILSARKEDHIKVFMGDKRLLETIVGFQLHQGIMAIGKVPGPYPLANIILEKPSSHFLVAVDSIANSENLGVIVRNCVAFGVDGLLVGETSCSPYLRRAVRMSMGAVFRIPVIHVQNLASTLRMLAEDHGTGTIATHPHPEGLSANAVDYSGSICLVFGSEGSGISPEVLQSCQQTVAIPMTVGTDSLNVASASAIVLYEARRLGKSTPQSGKAHNSLGEHRT